MKVTYKGFIIDVKRDWAIGGWENIYYSAYRISDGWCLEESFTNSAEMVKDLIEEMKELVDLYLENPKDYDYG